MRQKPFRLTITFRRSEPEELKAYRALQRAPEGAIAKARQYIMDGVRVRSGRARKAPPAHRRPGHASPPGRPEAVEPLASILQRIPVRQGGDQRT